MLVTSLDTATPSPWDTVSFDISLLNKFVQALTLVREFIFGDNSTGLVTTTSSGTVVVIGGEEPSLGNEIMHGQAGIYYGQATTTSTYFFPSATVEAWDAYMVTATSGPGTLNGSWRVKHSAGETLDNAHTFVTSEIWSSEGVEGANVHILRLSYSYKGLQENCNSRDTDDHRCIGPSRSSAKSRIVGLIQLNFGRYLLCFTLDANVFALVYLVLLYWRCYPAKSVGHTALRRLHACRYEVS